MKYFILLSIILTSFTLSGCMSFFYKMNRMEKIPFANEFIDKAQKNEGLDTTYNVPAKKLGMEAIIQKVPYDTREFLQGVIDNFGIHQLEENMELNLVNGYVMDIFLKSQKDDSKLHMAHINYGGEKDESLRNELNAFYDLWYVGGRVTKLRRRLEKSFEYDMDVEKGYEYGYYEDGTLREEFHGSFLNDDEGVARQKGTLTMYRQNGQKMLECKISDLQLDKESCKVWDENGNLKDQSR